MSSPHTVFIAVDPADMYADVNYFGMFVNSLLPSGIDLGYVLLDDWDGDGAVDGLKRLIVAMQARQRLEGAKGYTFGPVHIGDNPGIEITFANASDAVVWKLTNGGSHETAEGN